MKRKLFTFGIVILNILSTSTLLVTGFYVKTSITRNNSNILYVGGDGIGNYNNIKVKIDKASYGDTISIYDESSPYYESIVINETI